MSTSGTFLSPHTERAVYLRMMQQGQDVCVRHAVKVHQRLQKAALAPILALKIHSFDVIKSHLEKSS